MSPQPYRIVGSNQSLKPIRLSSGWSNLTNDEARGIVWMFEAPIWNATYVVGVDPAMGINGWDRTIPQDARTDNTAIEVFRVGKRETKVTDDGGKERIVQIPTDYQVAEYAAPVDYEVAAEITNVLGRLYRGTGAMETAHAIIEAYPGPGWMVEKALIQKYGYVNFYHKKYVDTVAPSPARSIGWQATRQSVRDLWIHGTRWLNNGHVVIRSPWLHSEMKTTDPIKFTSYTSEAASGFKDDRLRAAMLAFWAAHDSTSQIRVAETVVERNAKAVNWQMSDMSAEGIQDEWEKRFRDIGNTM